MRGLFTHRSSTPNSEMRSLLTNSDSSTRIFQAKYTKLEDNSPTRGANLLPNLQLPPLKPKRSTTEKKPQSLDYPTCYNQPYKEYIKKNARKSYLGMSYLYHESILYNTVTVMLGAGWDFDRYSRKSILGKRKS